MASATVSGRSQSSGVVLLALLGVHPLLHRGRRTARVDAGDADAVLALLGPQRVGERAETVLRGGVRRPVGVGAQAGAGVDEDDGAARRPQRRQRLPGELGRREQVDVEVLAPLAGTELGHRSEVDHTGGVHHGVERIGQLHGGQRTRVGQVGHDPVRAVVAGGQLRRRAPGSARAGPARRRGRARTSASAAPMPEPAPVIRWVAISRVKTILPKTSPSAIAANPSRACSIGSVAVDERSDAAGVEQVHQAGELGRGCPWSSRSP